MNTYKLISSSPFLDWKPGDVFSHDLSADEEAALLESGWLELFPNKYRNVGGSPLVLEGDRRVEPGEEFEAAFPQRQEALLAAHLERVEPKKKKDKD